MLKVYKMPNGRRYQFDEKDVPKGAVLVERKTEVKEEAPKANKAKKPANKAKKAVDKK